MSQINAALRPPLLWSEGARAFVCMIPMLVAGATGHNSALVALGQGGFFMSSLFLPKRIFGRFVMGSIIVGIGLGFYLLGGNVVLNPGMAILITFLVALNLSYLSGWKLGGPLALTLIMIYTAGLNTGSPEKASANFGLFALVMAWSTLVSMLPIWTPVEPPPPDESLDTVDLTEQGVRMGIGTSIALGISYLFGFAKLGWAPSAVGSIVRYDEKLSRLRAWARFLGTIGGALMAVVAMAITQNIDILIYFGVAFAVANGVLKKTKLGMMPLFYTATILLLYSLNSVADGSTVAAQRVAYNLVGILVGMLVIIYPFPGIMKWLNRARAEGRG